MQIKQWKKASRVARSERWRAIWGKSGERSPLLSVTTRTIATHSLMKM